MKNIIKTFLITPIFLLCFFAFPQDAAGLTFGYTTAGSSFTTPSQNYITTNGDTFLGAAGNGVSMSAYAKHQTSNSNIQMAIYDNAFPQNRIDYTGSVLVSTSAGWHSANLIGNVISDSQYYLCLNNQTITLDWYFDTGATNGRLYEASAFGTWGATITLDNPGTARIYSIYCTYTSSGAARRMFIVD